MGYLQTLAKALTGDGLFLPAPVRSYLKGQPQPLALDTRERLADWCAAHGYSDEQRQHLHNLIRTLVTRERYLRAVASGSSRIDLDGADTGPASDIERETAARGLAAAAARRAKPKAAIQANTGAAVGASAGAGAARTAAGDTAGSARGK